MRTYHQAAKKPRKATSSRRHSPVLARQRFIFAPRGRFSLIFIVKTSFFQSPCHYSEHFSKNQSGNRWKTKMLTVCSKFSLLGCSRSAPKGPLADRGLAKRLMRVDLDAHIYLHRYIRCVHSFPHPPQCAHWGTFPQGKALQREAENFTGDRGMFLL